jgi:hypothetical protein
MDIGLPWEVTDKAPLLREFERPAFQDGAAKNA